MAQQPPSEPLFSYLLASRLHSDIQQLVRLLWTSDQPDADTSAWQHTTPTWDRLVCLCQYSKLQSRQSNGHILWNIYKHLYQYLRRHHATFSKMYILKFLAPLFLGGGSGGYFPLLAACGLTPSTRPSLHPFSCPRSRWTQPGLDSTSAIILPIYSASSNKERGPSPSCYYSYALEFAAAGFRYFNSPCLRLKPFFSYPSLFQWHF